MKWVPEWARTIGRGVADRINGYIAGALFTAGCATVSWALSEKSKSFSVGGWEIGAAVALCVLVGVLVGRRSTDGGRDVHASHARHLRNSLDTIRLQLAGRLTGVTWDRLIEDGILNPAQIWLSDAAGEHVRLAILEPLADDPTTFGMAFGAGYALDSKGEFRMPVTGRAAGDVLSSGKGDYLPDVTKDRRWKVHPLADKRNFYYSLAMEPIKIGINAVAVLNVTSTEKDAFSETDIAYIELLSAVLEVVWVIRHRSELS